MVEKEDVELTSPHIKNTSTCGTLLTEHQLETAEDLLYYQSCKKDPHMTGQDKKKKKGIRMGPVSLGRTCEGGRVCMGRLLP